MAVLALHYWPGCSRDLLVACLCHDLGESIAGDIPCGAKQGALKTEIDIAEGNALTALGLNYSVDVGDALRLKYLDRLDAYLWAQHHAPHLMLTKEWICAKKWLIDNRPSKTHN